MNKTLIKFYRGTHGMGIVISITYGSDRIIFDFGAPFTPLTNIYDGTILPRHRNKLKDSLLLGKIPYVDGVFDKQELQKLPIISYQESDLNTAIFICHLHQDHMSEIDKVAKEIPVYIHKEGLKLLNCLNIVNNEKQTRSYSSFDYYQEIKIGNISLTPYYSDHPCPGASGFLIKTADSTIYYSGDIRFHGTNSQKAYQDLDKVSQEKIDLLIVDSTTTSPSEFIRNEQLEDLYRRPSKELLPGSIGEQDIYQDIYNSLKDYQGIAVFNQYNRDTSMMDNMLKLSNKLNRTIVWEESFAYIIKEMLKKDVPTINSISLKEIKNNPSKYMLQNSYPNILNLIDLDNLEGKYFHLFGEPLVQGQKEYNNMLNMINKLNWEFKTYSNLYSFSHAYPNHLAYMVEKINATSVVAVHSKNPEKLNPVNSIHVIPNDGDQYILDKGKLHKKDC